MPISVDIADRLYDYTDEEVAAAAIEEFQISAGLDDAAILAIWKDPCHPRRSELETKLFQAVDLNGSSKRAQSHILTALTLSIE